MRVRWTWCLASRILPGVSAGPCGIWYVRSTKFGCSLPGISGLSSRGVGRRQGRGARAARATRRDLVIHRDEGLSPCRLGRSGRARFRFRVCLGRCLCDAASNENEKRTLCPDCCAGIFAAHQPRQLGGIMASPSPNQQTCECRFGTLLEVLDSFERSQSGTRCCCRRHTVPNHGITRHLARIRRW